MIKGLLCSLVFSLYLLISCYQTYAITKTNYENIYEKWEKVIRNGDGRGKQVALNRLWFLKKAPFVNESKWFNPIIQLFSDPDPQVRAATAEYLGRIQSGRSRSSDIAKTTIIPKLISALRDRSHEVRREAAKALGYFNDTRSVLPLMEMLQDPDPMVTFESIVSLGMVDTEGKSILSLVNMVVIDDIWPHKLVQREAIRALRKIYTHSTADIKKASGSETEYILVKKAFTTKALEEKVVVFFLRKLNDRFFQQDIIKLLGEIGNPLALENLEREAAYNQNANVKEEALKAMDQIGRFFMEEKNHVQLSIVDACIASLADSSATVRKTAIAILGKSGDQRGIAPLLDHLKQSGEPEERLIILEALGNYKDSRVLEILLGVLSSGKPDDSTALVAIKALEVYSDSRILQVLPRYLGSFKKYTENKLVGKVFQQVLLKTEERRLVYRKDGLRYSVKIVPDKEVVVPRDSYDHMLKMFNPAAVDNLIKELSTQNQQKKVEVLGQLSRYEEQRIGKHVAALIKDPDPRVRTKALSLLFALNDDSHVREDLVAAKEDANAEVRKLANRLIAKLKIDRNKINAESLVQSLREGDVNSRVTAIKQINELIAEGQGTEVSQAVFELVIQSLGDNNFRVSREASRALRRVVDDQPIFDLLLSQLNNSSPKIRENVLGLLVEKSPPDNRAATIRQIMAMIYDDEKIVRGGVHRYFGKVTSRYGQEFQESRLVQDEVIPFLLKGVEQKNTSTQNEAIRALKYFPDKRVLEVLLGVAHDNRTSISVLGEYRDLRVMELFKKYLEGSDRTVQKAVLQQFLTGHTVARWGDLTLELVPSLIQLLNNSPHIEIRSGCAAALGKIGDSRAVESLIGLVNPQEDFFYNNHRELDKFRRSVLLALGEIGDSRAFHILIEAFGDEYLRDIAPMALGKFGDPRAISHIHKYLIDPQHDDKRYYPIRALGEIGHPDALNVLSLLLYEDHVHLTDNEYSAVFSSLSKINDGRALEMITNALSLASRDNFQNALRGLGCSGSQKALSKILEIVGSRQELPAGIYELLSRCRNTELIDAVVTYLRVSRPKYQRLGAMKMLSIVDSEKNKDIDEYLQDRDPDIQKYAKQTVQRRNNSLEIGEGQGKGKKDSKAKQILLVSFSLSSPPGGAAGVNTNLRIERGEIIEFEGQEIIKPLPSVAASSFGGGIIRSSGNTQLLQNSDIRKKLYSNRKLGSQLIMRPLEKPLDVSMLIGHLQSEDIAEKMNAIALLSFTGDQQVADSITPLLNDRNKRVRLSATRALGLLKANTTAPALLQLVDDPDLDVRVSAVWALGKLNVPGAVKTLILLLAGKERRLQERSIIALSEIKTEDAKRVLLDIVDGEEYQLKIIAMEAISNTMASSEMIDRFITHLSDKNEYVRQAAARSLGRLKSKESIPHLTTLLDDSDIYVKKWTARALEQIQGQSESAH